MTRSSFTTSHVKAELEAFGVKAAFDCYTGPDQKLGFLCDCPEKRPGRISFRALHYQGVRPQCSTCRKTAQRSRMQANRRVPGVAANIVEKSAIAFEHDDLAHRVGTYLRAHGARPLDKYSNQNMPMRFICGGSCGGNVHQITWAALRAGRAPRCPACRNVRLRGAEHHRYDPEIPDIQRARRRTAADRRWEQAVLHANASTCIITGRRGSAPHHLYGYDTHPVLRLLVQNGVCLTRRCHRQFHDQFGYGGNTFCQFVTFFEASTGQTCPLLDPLDIADLDQVFVD